MAPRDPHAPDCAIRGCTRVDGGHGVCRKHAELIPYALTKACMAEVMTTSYRIGQKYRRRYIAAVRAALREATP